jgi:hypothetical protein
VETLKWSSERKKKKKGKVSQKVYPKAVRENRKKGMIS